MPSPRTGHRTSGFPSPGGGSGLTQEEIEDFLGNSFIVAGTNMTITYDDGANTLTFDAAGSGSVATDAIWDAKGDLAVGTGADTAAKLTAGTNDHVLTADSAEATGLKWAAAPGAGGGVDTFGTPVANDFARFTDADTIEGRSYSETRTDLGLVVGTNVQAWSAVLDATSASFTTTLKDKLDGVEALADVTDAANVNTAGAVMEADYDAQTILRATTDNTPAALTVGEQTVVGRITAGNIAALTAAELRTLINVENGATADQTAAEVAFTPNGSIAATDVQAAIVEVRDEAAAASHNHAGSAITSGTVDAAYLPDASPTAEGVVELATVSEVDTGTDTTRAITPDVLAGSVHGTKFISFRALATATAWATGRVADADVLIPPELAGFDVVSFQVEADVKSSSATPTVKLERGRRASATAALTYADVTTQSAVIEVDEFNSKDGTAATINGSNDDLAAGDRLAVNITTAGTGTAGMLVSVGIRLP